MSDPDTGWNASTPGAPDRSDLTGSGSATDDVTETVTADQDEDARATLAALEEARARLVSVPASVVVANHAVGLYELAAIHLGAPIPDLTQAALAIDALGGLLESCGDRLGDEGATLHQALTTIRMVFVDRSTASPS